MHLNSALASPPQGSSLFIMRTAFDTVHVSSRHMKAKFRYKENMYSCRKPVRPHPLELQGHSGVDAINCKT